MKTLKKILSFTTFFLTVVILFSCEKNSTQSEKTGLAEFSIDISGVPTSKSADADSVTPAMHFLVSVEDLAGNKVLTDKLIPVYSFGTGFISENVEIPVGDFRLVKFLVINAGGKVVYATPMVKSEMSYLVKTPLSLPFRIEAEKVTKLAPEVLSVNDNPPGRFGYATFGMQVVNPLSFWTYCIVDNPQAAAPILITGAQLTISAPDGWRYTVKLAEKVTNVVIRGGYANYYFMIEKEGYLPQKFEFRAEQLKASTENNPIVLKIPFASQYKMLVFQPGPEKGIDAMISNLEPDKNFAGHKYFETTFLTEQMLTVMRTNRSLIHFDISTVPSSAVIKKVILRLCYDLPVPFDKNFMYLVNTLPGPGIEWYGAAFQKITEPWEENKVTWNNQPKTTETGQVFLAPFIKNTNVIEIDVTRLFLPSAGVTAPNYGMMFRLWPADRFPGFRFASSDFPVPEMRPLLRVYY